MEINFIYSFLENILLMQNICDKFLEKNDEKSK